MKWICVVSTLLPICASAAHGETSCPVPPGAVQIAIPSGLPPALRDAMSDIALPGEAFDTTDVFVKGHKHGRYIFVWNAGTRWIVATERGGIALHSAISVYDLGKDGKTVRLIDQRIGSPTNVCGPATKLAGK